MKKLLTIVALVVVLAGCSGGGVPWEDYDATVKTELDELAARADCAGLQEKFDIADQNNESTMNRTGHNNADLMGYINDLLEDAGCYG